MNMSGRPMQSVEIAARTVDEAVRLALEQLGRTRDQVDVEILSDTSDQEDGEALVRVIARGVAGQAVGAAPPARPVRDLVQTARAAPLRRCAA
jgi:spoIIIJ-associated protein